MIKSDRKIEVAIRKKLLELTKFESKYVLNGYSIYGTDLHGEKTLNNKLFESFDSNTNLIVFYLIDDNGKDEVIEEESNKYYMMKHYYFHISMYGPDSNVLIKKLKAKLLGMRVTSELSNDEDINIVNISSITKDSDFINNILYDKYDMKISFYIEHIIDKDFEEDDVMENDQLKKESFRVI